MGTPYLHSQTTALNPWIKRVSGNAPVRFFGLGCMGAMSAVQPGDGRLNPYGSYVTVLTQVEECPWTDDEAGVAFDVDNIWAVRTRAWQDDDPESGERSWWTMVPRVLPVGYEDRGRCRGYLSGLVQDFLGYNPMNGICDLYGVRQPIYWRTPTSDAAPADGYLWTPMNLNQLTVPTSGSTSGGFYKVETGLGTVTATYPPSVCHPGGATATNFGVRTWYYGGVIADHIGFRGGKVTINSFTTSPFPCGMYGAGTVRVVIGWDDAGLVYPNLPANIVLDTLVDWNDFVDLGPSGPYAHRLQAVVDMPALLSPLGQLKVWTALCGVQMAGDWNGGEFVLSWSPRTDVPLWYFASTRNRCAPGGVIVP